MKKTKKILQSFSALLAMVTPIATIISCSDRKGAYVQLVTDGAPIEDKSFNQQARDAAVDWAKVNNKKAGASQSQSSSPSDLTQAWQSAIDAGAEIVITTGFGSDKPFKAFADKNKNKKFIYVDGSITGSSNVVSLQYKTEQAAFLAGIATGIMLNMNYERFKSNGGLVVGAWGGQDLQPIWAIIGGFQQGIAYFNKHIAKDIDHMIHWVNPGANRKSMFSGTWDAGEGKPYATKLIDDKKADVILGAAGSQSNDGVAVIKNKNSKSLIVGVDTDQTIALGQDGKYAFTSIMKDIYTTVKYSIDVLTKKSNHKGIKAGQNSYAGLDADFVKLAPGLIDSDKSDKLVAGNGKIQVHFSDFNQLNELFKVTEINKWKSKKAHNVLDISNLYKEQSVSTAKDLIWSEFKGIDKKSAQDFNFNKAKEETNQKNK